MDIGCSNCGRPVKGNRFWCGKCRTYVCPKCLKSSFLCPKCSHRVTMDTGKLLGAVLLVVMLVMVGIFAMVFFVMDTEKDLDDYSAGDTIELKGRLSYYSSSPIWGNGTPGNITWHHPSSLDFADERGDARVVITDDTAIHPYFIHPAPGSVNGTYRYAFGPEDDMVITVLVEGEDENRQYTAGSIGLVSPPGKPTDLPNGTVVFLAGRLEGTSTHPLMGTGLADNVTWKHNGTVTVVDGGESCDVEIDTETMIAPPGTDGDGDGKNATSHVYRRGDRVRVEALVLNGTGGPKLVALTVSPFIPQEDDEEFYAVIVLLAVMVPMVLAFVLIPMFFILRSRKWIREHMENTRNMPLSAAPRLTGGMTGLLDPGLEWRDNPAVGKYRKMMLISGIIAVCAVLATGGLFFILGSSPGIMIGTVLIGVFLVMIPLLLVFVAGALTRTVPRSCGISKNGVACRYGKEPQDNSLVYERWSDVKELSVVFGGRRIQVRMNDGTERNIGEVDPSVSRFIREGYAEYRRTKSEEDDGKAEVPAASSRDVVESGIASTGPDRDIEWKAVGRSSSGILIAGLILMILPVSLFLISPLPMQIRIMIAIIFLIIGLVLLLVGFALRSLPLERVGVSPRGIYIEARKGKKTDLPGHIPLEAIGEIRAEPMAFSVKLKNGISHQIPGLSAATVQWLKRETALQIRGKDGKGPGTDRKGPGTDGKGPGKYGKRPGTDGKGPGKDCEKDMTWTENSCGKKIARNNMIMTYLFIGLGGLMMVAGVVLAIVGESLSDSMILGGIGTGMLGMGALCFFVSNAVQKQIPLSVGTGRQGLSVRWMPGTKKQWRTLESLSWGDIRTVEETSPAFVPQRGAASNRIVDITDRWAGHHRLSSIDDDCANSILAGWERYGPEKK